MKTTNTVRTWILIILILFISGFMYVYRGRVNTYAHMALKPMQTALNGDYGQSKPQKHKPKPHKQSHETQVKKHK